MTPSTLYSYAKRHSFCRAPRSETTTRPGTVRRELLVSSQPELVRMAAGLDFLLRYPYGCTEQQLSRARAYVALKKFRKLLRQGVSEMEVERAVREALDSIPPAVDGNGLVAYWPGSEGYVSLTPVHLDLTNHRALAQLGDWPAGLNAQFRRNPAPPARPAPKGKSRRG